MKKGTLNFLVDAGLLMLLLITILTATVEIFIPCFVHVILGLLLSAGALIHVALHWEWIKNAFQRFGHLSSQVRINFLLNLVLFLAYSAAGAMGLIARSFIFAGPLRHVLGFFHVLLVSGVLLLQSIHLIRHWKWVMKTAQRMLRPSSV
ncbi:MAG TPA: hypothetical protein PKM21_11745 [Anaerolineales bacterium]|nr:hypothetical protein [Anaerolineales bacterium]